MSATKHNERKFAAFDIDGTLIRWQLYHAIVEELITQKLISADASQRIDDARKTWRNRMHSFSEYEEILVSVFRASRSSIRTDAFDKAVETVFETHKDQVYTYTRDLIKSLKAKGYLLFAVSGSQQEIVEKLGDYYGFDDVIGSQHERMPNGMLGDAIFSPVVHGKAGALKKLCDKHGITYEDSYAIGDSLSDTAILELVGHPIAFNPDQSLFRIATERGWKIVIERKNVIYELEKSNGSYLLAEAVSRQTTVS